MKKQIRYGLFETNSSMCQSLIIMTKKQYENFLENENNNEWVWDSHNNKMISYSEAIEQVKKEYAEFCKKYNDEFVPLEGLSPEEWEEWLYDYGYKIGKNIFNHEWMEYKEVEYTTEHGDELVIIHGAGMDG